jgi:hypothetical protein
MTNFPDDLDVLLDPVAGDPLLLSNGKASTVYVKDLNDATEAMQRIILGPVFTNAQAATATAESLICDCSATVGGSPSPGTWFNVNATNAVAVDTTFFSTSPSSIKSVGMKTGLENYGGIQTAFGINFTSAVSRATGNPLALDLRISQSGAGISPASELFELVVSDAASFTGNLIRLPIPDGLAYNAFMTLYVPVHTLVSVKCIGVRLVGQNLGNGNLSVQTVNIDNIRWAAQTELDAALESSTSDIRVVIPPSYVGTGTQRPLPFGTGQDVVDFRPREGIRTLRDFQVFPSETVDKTASIQAAIDRLPDGWTLEFEPRATYRVMGNLILNKRERVHIDGRGATIFRDAPVASEDFLTIDSSSQIRVRNLRIQNENPETWGGTGTVLAGGGAAVLTAEAGTPVINATGALLSTKGDSVIVPQQAYQIRDRHGDVRVDVTLYDTTHVASDCLVEWYDVDAPTTPISGFTQTAGGPLRPGTWYYRYTFVDAEGHETGMSPPVAYTITGVSWCDLRMTIPAIPSDTSLGDNNPPWLTRRIYATNIVDAAQPDNAASYAKLMDLVDNTVTSFVDTFERANTGTANAWTLSDNGAGNVDAGTHRYFISTVNPTTGQETIPGITSGGGGTITLTGNRQVLITNLPTVAVGGKRRIYRTTVAGGTGGSNQGRSYRSAKFLADVTDSTATTYVDNIADSGLDLTRCAGSDVSGISKQPLGVFQQYITTTATSGSPQTVSVLWPATGRGLEMRLGLRVKKVTSGTNTITVTAVRTFGRRWYDTTYEGSAGINVVGTSADVVVESCRSEGTTGDGFNVGAGDSVNRIFFRDCWSRCARRQGMSITGGYQIVFEDCHIFEPARTGMDVEPLVGVGAICTDLLINNVEFRNVGNNAMLGHDIPNITVMNCRMHGHANGTIGFIALGGDHVSVLNCDGPWFTSVVSGTNPYIDGLTATALSVTNETDVNVAFLTGFTPTGRGGIVKNVKLSGTSKKAPAFICTHQGASVSNITIGDVLAVPTGPLYGPFVVTGSGTDIAFSNLDPGLYRQNWPATFKGIIPGSPLWFPRGLNMQQDGVLGVRGISGGTTRANNLNGTVAISAGSTTGTVTFPTKTYPNFTSFSLGQSTITGGTLTAGTYRVRIASRSAVGGPVVALTEQSIALTGGNNAIRVIATGLRQGTTYIEGATIYLSAVGGGTGIYPTRFDIVPTSDLFFLGSNGTDQHVFAVLGTTAQALAQDTTGVLGFGGGGYSDAIAVTPTTEFAGSPSLSGLNWLCVNETGYEAGRTYKFFATPSWPTTVSVGTKRVDGMPITFGVACPSGNGTIDWRIEW